jgi:hypothetical protein
MSIIKVRLTDPTHLLPWPQQKGRFCPDGVFEVEEFTAYWFGAIADGSLTKVEDEPKKVKETK